MKVFLKSVIIIIFSLSILAGCRISKTAEQESASGSEAEAPVPPSETGLPADLAEILDSAGFQFPNGGPAPIGDFLLKPLNGETLAFSSIKGRTVLLNFWATWCPPCIAELPSLGRLHGLMNPEDFVLLAVSVGETRETVESFVREMNMTFPVFLDEATDLGSKFGVSSIPATYLIDSRGRVLARKIGAYEWDNPEIVDMLKQISRLQP